MSHIPMCFSSILLGRPAVSHLSIFRFIFWQFLVFVILPTFSKMFIFPPYFSVRVLMVLWFPLLLKCSYWALSFTLFSWELFIPILWFITLQAASSSRIAIANFDSFLHVTNTKRKVSGILWSLLESELQLRDGRRQIFWSLFKFLVGPGM